MKEAEVEKKVAASITIVKQMKDYSKESVFIKKAEDAVLLLQKHGLPKEFEKK